MPTYEYECQACKCSFDVFQAMTAKPVRKCPHCGKLRVKRLIGAGMGFLFKGSGFYETDYKKKPVPSGEAKAPEKPEKLPAEKSSTKAISNA